MQVITDQTQMSFNLPDRLPTAPSVAEHRDIIAEALHTVAGDQTEECRFARAILAGDKSVL